MHVFDEMHVSPGETFFKHMVTPGTELLRLFMMPGVSHCAGGVGPDSADLTTHLARWVEDGTAPAHIVASKVDAGKVIRTRPLCPYAQVARYSGNGSIDDASNFACVAGGGQAR